MIRRPPRSTRTDTLFPYTTLFRSNEAAVIDAKRIGDTVQICLAVAQEVVPVSLAPIWRIEGQNNANIAVFRGFDLGAKGQVIGRLPHRLVGLGAFAPVTPAIRVRGPVRPRQADAITHPAFRPISSTTGSAARRLA